MQEVVTIFAATANPLTIIVAEQSPPERRGGVVGVIDGAAPLGVEGSDDESERKELLRRFGYKR